MFTQPVNRFLRTFTGSILVLMLFTLPAYSAVPVTANPDVSVYVTDGSTYVPLDAETLRDDATRPVIRFDDRDNAGFALFSTDGSTVATTQSAGEIIVRDGVGGDERTSFFIDGSGWPLALSADGSRLVVQMSVDYGRTDLDVPAWKIFDTSTGRLIAAVQGERMLAGPRNVVQVDRDAMRLFQLVTVSASADPVENTGPGLARLVEFDLTNGQERGRLDLPEVHMGFWRSGKRPRMAAIRSSSR